MPLPYSKLGLNWERNVIRYVLIAWKTKGSMTTLNKRNPFEFENIFNKEDKRILKKEGVIGIGTKINSWKN